MNMPQFLSRKPLVATLLGYGVALHGLLIIAETLDDQLSFRGIRPHISSFVFGIPLVAGLSLLYVSLYLLRRKRTAWLVATAVYLLLLGFRLGQLWFFASHDRHMHMQALGIFVSNVLLPIIMLAGLFLCRRVYTVRSDVQSFAASMRVIILVLAVALIYGVSGFLLLDKRDFHQDISWREAVHRTIDQFDLTTTHQLVPYTRRAKLFQDSLPIISVGAVAYALISLFQPLRARFTDQTTARLHVEELLKRHPSSSEDFFKLWPTDKLYYFNLAHTAGLAYGVHRGVALVVGDPFGDPKEFDKLLDSFDELCRTNDWAMAFVHTEPQWNELYKRRELGLQKIGQEAVIDLEKFQRETSRDKYFRHIRNKLSKLGYTTELLQPPHSEALISRLTVVSREWLGQPGRDERGFMMGYFSPRYMQLCPVMVLRDAAGTIQAFINQIQTYSLDEANFDLLRHTKEAPGNSNDFLLMAFIDEMQRQGYKRLNLGLCPLAGLDSKDEERSVVDSALRFVYANGDRFYSFSGLYRFKSKYEPEWSSRYIAYRGGIRNFTRVVNALNRAMKTPRLHK